MLKVLIASCKGGCGKTTLATHLAAHYAVEGRNTVLVDCDRLASSRHWCERRAGHPTDATLAALRDLGHRVEVIEEQGHICTIRILPDGSYQGAADPRKYAGKASAW